MLRVIFANGGVPYAVNVYGFSNTGNVAITQTLTNTVGAAIKAAVVSSGLQGALGTAITLTQVGLRDLRSANQPEFLDSGVPATFNGAGDLLPLNVTLCATLRTALAGRSFRGRSYISGFTETVNQANGTASAATGTAVTAWINAINSALQSSGLALAVLSRTTSRVTPVTSVQVRDLVWDTQRRRAIPGI
jgi:hypothetical protein